MIRFLADLFVDTSPLPNANNATSGNLTNIFNIVLGTMAAVAFLMLIISGFRYTISQGQPDKVAEARRTIAYSIIGLVIIASAATIVNFVIDKT